MSNHEHQGVANDESTEEEDSSFIGDHATFCSADATSMATNISADNAHNYKVKICKELGLLRDGSEELSKHKQIDEEVAGDISDNILQEYIQLRLTNERMALELIKRDNLMKVDEILDKLIKSNFPLNVFDKLLQASSTNANSIANDVFSDAARGQEQEQPGGRKRKKTDSTHTVPLPPRQTSRHRRYNSEIGISTQNVSPPTGGFLPQLQSKWGATSTSAYASQPGSQLLHLQNTSTPDLPSRFQPSSDASSGQGLLTTLQPSVALPSRHHIIQGQPTAFPSLNMITIGPTAHLPTPSSQVSNLPPFLSSLSKKQPTCTPQSLDVPYSSVFGENKFTGGRNSLKPAPNILPITSSSTLQRGHRRTQSAQVRVVPEMSTFTVSRSPTATIGHRVEDSQLNTLSRGMPSTQGMQLRSPSSASGASTSSKVSFLIHTPRHPPKR